MDVGYVKLYRKLRRWPLWKTMSWEQRGVMITMLWLAKWRDEEFYNRGSRETVQVPRGSFVASLRQLAQEADVGLQVVRTALGVLTGDPGDGPWCTVRNLTHGPTHFFINNYEMYQGDEPQDLTQGQHSPNTALTQPPYMKKVKKVKKGKKQGDARSMDSVLPSTEYAPDAREVALKWMSTLPHLQDPAEQERQLPAWLRDLDRLNRLDGRSWPDIRRLVAWVQQDDGDGRWRGWARNCQSPRKLRDRDRQNRRYWDVIWQQMEDARRSPRVELDPDRVDWDAEEDIPFDGGEA